MTEPHHTNSGISSPVQAALTAFPDLFFWLAPDGTITDYKVARTSDLFVPPSEFLGKKMPEVLPPEAGGRFERALEQIHGGERLVGLEYSLPFDEAVRHFEARVLSLDTEMLFVSVRDVTDRRVAEEALAAEKRLLAVTLSSIADGVITTDLQGSIVLLNNVAERLTGWHQVEAIGRAFSTVFHLGPTRDGMSGQDVLVQVIQTGQVIDMKSWPRLISRDGSERAISLRCSPLHDHEGAIMGVVSVFRDITEHERVVEEQMRASKLESVGMLAAGIAHDFNNILTAILGNLSLAKLVTQPKLSERIDAAERASLRAKDLTAQLLTFAKGGVPVKKPVLLTEAVKDSAQFALHGSNVRAEFNLDPQLPAVQADEGQIRQVVQNLILNAAQSMPSGGLVQIRLFHQWLNAGTSSGNAAGNYVILHVRDHGCGIPASQVQKIFDPYFTTKESSSGLGLATAYSIIRRHEGFIRVESTEQQGTLMEVALPAIAAPVENPENSRPATEVQSGQGRILVMDDESTIRELVSSMLTHLGYDVVAAADGTEAVERYRAALKEGRRFDAIIMDLTIPGGMGGQEAVQKILTIDPLVRAIVSSGYSNNAVIGDLEKHGFRASLAKPYRVQELSRILQDVLVTR